MAERFVRFDDLDGTVIEEGQGGTVTVGFGEERYDLDLKESNIESLKKALEPFLEAGRKMETSTPVPAVIRTKVAVPAQPSRSAVDRKVMQDIRKWAKKKGYAISERGRIPHAVMAAYTQENLAALAK